ncbi:putative SLC26A/SulP transporter, STAS domain, STAS domain superfamily [Helianthus annuus]|nr:putative SLC26A/SulP transporter, STAS domain, STAS domain superfamily [Helianthus annuus]KAJ0584433.1 putative SLC26A/SulP transporter, STAS domain, STAS domain superfamily [Helianthus annuus]KAJ0630551.1 putative SLC26A/SulP transporter, STAS domain, STAS domain superfamily [Helianthus annuus]KAJ0747056.1 putative SLC26A/SulP transporter, STAS domain, STAS domain superfamily [Helianthus annuus]KAJ0918796.1 putative SLC26A/SulP transporter, STAS domain, STAS domain superfamily [Helianthus a
MASSNFVAEHSFSVEGKSWVLNSPDPPGFLQKILHSIKKNVASDSQKKHSPSARVLALLTTIFPVLTWGRNYKPSKFKNDLIAGLTLASLSIPQSIGYAGLANLDPQYGLYGSVVPPLIYSVMGTSQELAIGPVAVVSLLISSMISKLVDPAADPVSYRKLVFTATFFAGTFQALFGILRLGFLIDFLSHAAIVGFMAGAAIVIGLQQLKSLLGISHFTTKTDVVSVLEAVVNSLRTSWYPLNFVLGCSFLIFILITRFIGKKKKKLFWLPAISPVISVIISTLIVYLTRADEHGVKIIKHFKGGLNPSSLNQLEFNSPHLGEVAKIGFICATIALTEAVAVGRSFASIKGYNLDGNKEMLAMGFMNIAGSMSSCYVTTGSFSRTAVNVSAGCESAVSNIVMAITVFISLQVMTKLLYYTPLAILASIILSALPGLIDYNEAYHIWKVDKVDFLACAGAFFGVLFASVEIGLLVAVGISFGKLILNSIRSDVEELGRLPGSDIFCDKAQYPGVLDVSGVRVIRLNSGSFCFANANPIKERITSYLTEKDQATIGIILDMSNVMSIDSSGIVALEEIHKKLVSRNVHLAIANPRWKVIHKLKIGGVWFRC